MSIPKQERLSCVFVNALLLYGKSEMSEVMLASGTLLNLDTVRRTWLYLASCITVPDTTDIIPATV